MSESLITKLSTLMMIAASSSCCSNKGMKLIQRYRMQNADSNEIYYIYETLSAVTGIYRGRGTCLSSLAFACIESTRRDFDNDKRIYIDEKE